MSVLVVGAGKTGTTGLYTSIKSAVRERGGDRWYCLFEPVTATPFRGLRRFAPDRPVLTKVMVHRLRRCEVRPATFEHRVLAVRDPRDVLVSRLLFRPLIRASVRSTSSERLERFLTALREKEQDPAAWSVLGLHRLADELEISRSGFETIGRAQQRVVDLDRRGIFRVSRYEDFVDGTVDALAEHLGFELGRRETSSGSWLGHIERTKGRGEWRSWLRPEDVAFFRPIFEPYMTHFGYGDDWDLAHAPEIDPDTCSRYVQRKLVDRRQQVIERYSEPWSTSSVTTPEQVARLLDMADDGDAVSCHRLGLVLRDGGPVPADPAGARRWAEHGALQGHVPSMRLLAELFDARGDGERSQQWHRAAAEMEADARERDEARQRRQARRRRPVTRGRAVLAAPRRLWRRYRSRRPGPC
jgi:hypothetical protein